MEAREFLTPVFFHAKFYFFYEFVFIGSGNPVDSLRVLQRELGVAQHHDAITGTCTRAVDSDYHFRLRYEQKTVQD